MNRRSLVADAPPRHPLRQMILPSAETKVRRNDDQDLKLFVLSFTAFFVCFYTLIM
jgi:hypothetical protein